ncbi:S53 family peptidase [Kitasatospora paranensis]|uniref:Protease pro-enzyme activation domain-containing protein n=1 Tax=Kitasatospora paranensis TaxID=258053 RepID=A0ABW2G2Z8_9ACTN
MLDPLGPIRTPRTRGIGRATTLAVVTAALVAGAGLPTLATAQAESLTPKRVGSAPVVPHGATKSTAPADITQIDLSITLQPRDQVALTTFVNAVSNPASPLYKHYLGTGEFGKRFGADAATVASVRQALTAAGLHPGEVSANGLTIPVKATVAEAKKAFDTDFAGYKLADGSTGFSNTKAPAVRGDVAGKIAGITGLDTATRATPRNVPKQKPKPAKVKPNAVAPHNINANPHLCSDWSSFLGSQGMVDGQNYYSSGTLATAYDMNNMPDGAFGATVAIMSLENYSSAAVNEYQSCNGTKANVSNVRVGGQAGAPDTANGEGGETALDIETVASLAPGSTILVYQDANTEQGLVDNYSRIVNDNRASVVSISWGRCDLVRGADSTLNLILQQAAAQGQSVVAASGDSGSTDCYRYGGTQDARLSVDNPAALPYITGVGGTSHSGSVPSSFSTWNDGQGAGGGGVSKYWKLSDADNPAGSVHGAGYDPTVCGAGAGESCRQVPDVSALADPNHGYLVFTNVDSQGVWYSIYGGTSAAAPLWAAIVATANSSVACAANGPVGFLNPALYKLVGNTSVFNDVSDFSSNDLTASGYFGGSYQATGGYDMATGLGSPKGRGLIAALCRQLPSQPAGSFTSVSPTRLLDTGVPGAIPARGNTSLQIAGGNDAKGNPNGVPAGVTAVALNVTVANTSGVGYLTVWPTGKAQPVTSNINWVDHSGAVPNLVTVPVGAGGKISMFNGAWSSPARVVVDLLGYYTPDTAGANFVPLAPARLFDTRYGDANNTAKAPVAGGADISVKIAGGKDAKGNANGVPATNVTAVVLNTTVTRGQGDGWMAVIPTGGAVKSSNLNWTDKKTVPNLVVVPVGTDGKVTFHNGMGGQVDVLADVFGYFTSDSGAKFHVAGPKRIVDTRYGKGAAAPGQINGNTLHINLNDSGVLAGATSVVLNVTVVNTHGDGFLTAWPGNTTKPGSSNLNWMGVNNMIANAVVVPVHDNSVDITTNSPADVIVDLMGYYSAS